MIMLDLRLGFYSNWRATSLAAVGIIAATLGGCANEDPLARQQRMEG